MLSLLPVIGAGTPGADLLSTDNVACCVKINTKAVALATAFVH